MSGVRIPLETEDNDQTKADAGDEFSTSLDRAVVELDANCDDVDVTTSSSEVETGTETEIETDRFGLALLLLLSFGPLHLRFYSRCLCLLYLLHEQR